MGVNFYSTSPNLRVQLEPGGFKTLPDGVHVPVRPTIVMFNGCQFDTDDEETIKKLKGHLMYGRNKAFWCEDDLAPAERMADRLARLEAENKALKARMGVQTVVQVNVPSAKDEKEDESSEPTGLEKLYALKRKAKELGIEAQKGWKSDDYEKAIAGEKEGAQ
jgi:hypothetical protein